MQRGYGGIPSYIWQPLPMQSQDVPISFPTSGLNVSSEFGRQPADTCQSAQNVRVYDTFELRRRGGSRSGLIKLINEMLNGDNPIQHLAIIVDPTTPAIAADHDGVTEDTSTNNIRVRNPGRHIRLGGSGRPINRNIGDSVSSFSIIQAGLSDDPILPTVTVALSSSVNSGDLLIAFARTSTVGALADPTVTNGTGSSFTKIGGETTFDYPTDLVSDTPLFTARITLWKFIATGSVDDKTILMTPPSLTNSEMFVIHIRGQSAISPINDIQTSSLSNINSSTQLTSITGGPIAVDTAGSMAFLLIAADGVTNKGSSEPILTPQGSYISTPGANGLVRCYSFHKISVSTTQNPEIDIFNFDITDSIQGYGWFSFFVKPA